MTEFIPVTIATLVHRTPAKDAFTARLFRGLGWHGKDLIRVHSVYQFIPRGTNVLCRKVAGYWLVTAAEC